MRSVAVYYKEYSTIEKLQLLGEEYLRQMKRDLNPSCHEAVPSSLTVMTEGTPKVIISL